MTKTINAYSRQLPILIRCRLSLLGRAWVLVLSAATLTLLPITSQGAEVSVVNLHSFDTYPNGEVPYSGLVQGTNGNFYGTTFEGGPANAGVIYEVTAKGAVSTLYSFTNGVDGAFPQAGLVLANDGNFYGTAAGGGSNGFGSIFRITPGGNFSPLYSFTLLPKSGLNQDGAYPAGNLTRATDGNLYGTASAGGASGSGTIFKISLSGAYQLVYAFSAVDTNGENSEGSDPESAVIQGADGNLYGTASSGGANGFGTVFMYNLSLSQISVWHSFQNGTDGANPMAALVQGTDGYFYGTTSQGGTGTFGTTFKVSNGGVFAPLYSFTDQGDGANPVAPLVQGTNSILYGTTSGSQSDFGTVFKMTTNGTVTGLYIFTGGNDGGTPTAGLAPASNGVFYGTTSAGGSNNVGAVFSITSGGTFNPVMSFIGGYDGIGPETPLLLGTNGIFYGTTYQGGATGDGVIFGLTTNGGFSLLYTFTNGQDGEFPSSGLTQGSDGNFYGETDSGGPGEHSGVVYKFTAGALTVLHAMDPISNGSPPIGGLVQGSNGNFYGTTYNGGTPKPPSPSYFFGFGSVFEITPLGVFTNLYVFTNDAEIIGLDGVNPKSGLVLGTDGNFYGTTSAEGPGPAQNGGIFKISQTGAFTPLYMFTNGLDGAYPRSGLFQWRDGNFYGTTPSGGAKGYGTLYSITPAGSFAALYSFTNGIDGGIPDAGLVQGPGGNLYGTASIGGAYGVGTIFEWTTNGTFVALYSFTGTNDGSTPMAPLVLGPDGNLYGTTYYGGDANSGTAFKVLFTLTAPQLTSITMAAGTTLTWSTVPGQMYQLQFAPALMQAWNNLGNPTNGNSGSASYTDSSIGNVQRYYRVYTYSP